MGAGRAGEQAQALNALMQVQGQMITQGGLNYLVSPKNIYNAATRMAEAMGYSNPDLFFQDPDSVEPPQPPPDPDMEKVKLEAKKIESDAEIRSGEIQLKAMKEKNIMNHRAQDLALKEKIDLERIASQERIAEGAQQAQLNSAMLSIEGRDDKDEEEKEEK